MPRQEIPDPETERPISALWQTGQNNLRALANTTAEHINTRREAFLDCVGDATGLSYDPQAQSDDNPAGELQSPNHRHSLE
jgi:hypothetical protein